MLQNRTDDDSVGKALSPDQNGASLLSGIDIVKLYAAARRHLKIVVVSVIICLSLFITYGLSADVKYTAQTSILIGNRQIRAIQDISAQPNSVVETSLVDNQTEVLRSERVLLEVIKQNQLMIDPEFNGTAPPSIAQIVFRFIASLNPMRLFSTAPSNVDPEFRMQRTVIARLTDAIKITRVGKSNVVQVAVTVKSAKKAAILANGVAKAYLADQIESRIEAAKGAGQWFRDRLKELREQSVEASNAVERYRSGNNLVSTNGQLVTDQQLAQLNTELALASADAVRKQARYDNLKAQVDSRRVDTIVTEALENSVITQLRQRLADATKRYNEAVSRLGARHESAINRKAEISQYEALIFEELRRFLSSYEGELQVAKERKNALLKQSTQASNVTSTANASLVQLRQLEQEATALTGLYQNYLQRYQETIQQESLPINDARIITDAAAPLLPSEPRMPLLAAAGILLGIGIGAGIGAFRELSDRGFRTTDQIKDYLGVDVFGILPNISEPPKSGGFREGVKSVGSNSASSLSDIGNYAINHPFSRYSETLRAVKIDIEGNFLHDRAKIIGIVSTIPREGKSTVTMNFASLLALQGSRVIVIDADLREAGLTRLAGLKPSSGLGEVLADDTLFDSVLVTDPKTGVTILPATVNQNAFISGDLIASSAMEKILSVLSRRCDYIIVDLPPLGPVVDSRAIAPLLDAIVMVIEWGSVSRELVRSALAASPSVRDKLVGVILNKVEIDKLRGYEPNLLGRSQEALYSQYYK